MSNKNSESLSEVHGSVITSGKTGWRKLMAFIGPAYLVSVGYMDPGNWATDIAGGSQFGYKLIWVLLMSNLMALLLQSLSARLGIVRGLDLAQASRNTYPSYVNYPLYVLAQIAIIACDLAEIIGMAIGLNLLFGLPLIWGVSITILDTFLLLFLMNKGMRMMEVFIVSMVFIVGISFLTEMFIVKPLIGEVLSGFAPSMLSGNALYIAIGIIGATVMPHNLYLHSSLVQTRKIERTAKGIKDSLKYNLIDTTIALNLAFFVNAAILILAATAFYKNGLFEVAEIQDAYKLLDNIFGSVAPTLFAIALIASGQSSTITGTLAGQIVMEGHLNLRIQPWIRRLLTRLLAIIPAFFTIMFFGEEALGSLLILSQVVLSLQLGFAVIPLIHFNSDRQKMKEYTIKTWVKILAWLSALIIVSLNVQLVIEEIGSWLSSTTISVWWIYLLVIPLAISIGLLLLYVFLMPFFRKHELKISNVPHGEALEIGELEKVEYKKIGITVDFSKNDRNTFRHALIQGGKSADYYLIHIVETAAAKFHGEKVLDHETQSDTDNLEKYQQNLKDLGYQAHIEIGYGTASKAISEIVKAKNLDLLVMGAHGHKGISDLIFGTTVDTVRHNVNIPIMIVK
ncbi:MAG: iron/manganese transporter [Sphingobacteriales bacterium 17-39-43]|uniref:Nramp family divalent metal transporter n=1 Tax=Daejeonella sp. TaxID=2805397 RepID=UPI000BCBEA51|nr:Nramp family divalent metal transporter [Daejeonella sp.]OYZ29503.1 MAG: iron/manganese transporter [Sphingobacteriales bacterium 16-39-50]OZA22632.1 MAG: iron/manganese transporter [Sphingobacteriales bacterium 17-39-43]HQT24432.1 Nramp family divalent metal transporter [Daejeonella sp.]HQT58735.1 Nramp family divalent metal transporter [Daejeonella sp.]